MREAPMHLFALDPLPDDVRRALRRLARAESGVQLAVLPDVHLAGETCVGVALATTRFLFPEAVGGDIGCGMTALSLGVTADAIRDPNVIEQIFARLQTTVPIHRHSRGGPYATALPRSLIDSPLSDATLERWKHREGTTQFGTLGRGNHFLEFQADEDDRLWITVHSGSRATGQAIRSHHLRVAERRGSLDGIDADDETGQRYLQDVAWACRYATESRATMLARVVAALHPIVGSVDAGAIRSCDHNHVRRETIGGRELWVHRKGAIGAAVGEPGIIPGSMGTATYHVEGRGLTESLCSSSHGAGRRMTRTEARKRISPRALQRQLGDVSVDPRVMSRLCDEAPDAYRDIEKVLRVQRDLTRVVRRLTPILNYKGAT